MSQLSSEDHQRAGQLIGMMTILSYIERNGGITQDMIDRIKRKSASDLEKYFDCPYEDIILKLDNIMESKNL